MKRRQLTPGMPPPGAHDALVVCILCMQRGYVEVFVVEMKRPIGDHRPVHALDALQPSSVGVPASVQVGYIHTLHSWDVRGDERYGNK